MKIKIGGYALLALALALICGTPAEAKGPFDAFKGNGRANGSITLVGQGSSNTSCSRSATPFGDGTNLAFTLSCRGSTSFTLSCRLKAQGTRLSGSCSAGTALGSATLSGSGSIRGNRIHLSMVSSFGSHSNMTITAKSLSMRSRDARYVKALKIRAS